MSAIRNQRACAVTPPERCPRGRRSTPGKRVWGHTHRGFESLPLRQNNSLTLCSNRFCCVIIIQLSLFVPHSVHGRDAVGPHRRLTFGPPRLQILRPARHLPVHLCSVQDPHPKGLLSARSQTRLHDHVSNGYTTAMATMNAGLRIRVERTLRDEVLQSDKPEAQVIHEVMRGNLANRQPVAESSSFAMQPRCKSR